MAIADVKRHLPPLDFNHRPLTTQEQHYAHYYGIDFAHTLPGITHTLGHIDSGPYRIACQLYRTLKAKGSVFLLHGYYDHVGLYQHVIRYLLQRGYHVFAYDLPGHGLSSGAPATIPNFSHYRHILADLLQRCTGKLPSPWHAFGQSTGSAILTDYLLTQTLAQKPLHLQQVVLAAPLVRPYRWWLGRLTLHLVRPFTRQIKRRFQNNSRDTAFLTFMRQDPLAPTVLPVAWVTALARWIPRIEQARQRIAIRPCILQGTNDTTVDAKHNLPVLQRLYQAPHILLLEGAKHHLANELVATRQYYMDWLSSFI